MRLKHLLFDKAGRLLACFVYTSPRGDTLEIWDEIDLSPHG